ncbi:MAG: branched-chain amino acid ABC transporter permease, partial [Gemmatimonadetes bacterium]|nr:branched-chain amino acid ABC transporter permease [Gemmatimonadota bacterium]
AFFIQMLNGLSFGAVLFFLASGFTLIFGLMRITNLAHGGFYLVGGYIGITTVRVTGSFFVAMFVSAIAITL